MQVVIRLRRSIEHGLRHPILGPLLLVLLAVVLALMVVHEGSEEAIGDAGDLCVGIALLLVAIVALVRVRPLLVITAVEVVRGPPGLAVRALADGCSAPSCSPLRL